MASYVHFLQWIYEKNWQLNTLLLYFFSFLVVSFFDVWNRSSCQPLEKLVSVVSEYPHEVEHVFKPSCVSLRRCCGCCRDEALQCVPVEMANITMEVGENTIVPFILGHRVTSSLSLQLAVNACLFHGNAIQSLLPRS